MSARRLTSKSFALPAALILLCSLPIVASIIRVLWFMDADRITDADSLRFLQLPFPILTHVIFASLFLLLGAVQMSAALRNRYRQWHRRAGYASVAFGLFFALSGVWMTAFYTPHSLANSLIDLGRIILGLALAVFLVLGVYRATQRKIPAHRAWMIRAYAIGASTGVQSFLIGLSVAISGGFSPELADQMMLLGWVLTILVAEYIIHRKSFTPPKARPLA